MRTSLDLPNPARCQAAQSYRHSVRATVRFWWDRFGPMFAAEIRKRLVQGFLSSSPHRHLDEMFVKINGERHYLFDRPGFDIGGNVNIGNDVGIDVGDRAGIRDKIGKVKPGSIDRPTKRLRPGEDRLGDLDPDKLTNHKPKNFDPGDKRRDDARKRIEAAGSGKASAKLPTISAPKDAKLPAREPTKADLPAVFRTSQEIARVLCSCP